MATVFIREGIAIGLLSYLLALVTVFPLSKLLGDAVGISMIGCKGRNGRFANALCWTVLTLSTFSVCVRYPLRDGSWNDRLDQRAIPVGALCH